MRSAVRQRRRLLDHDVRREQALSGVVVAGEEPAVELGDDAGGGVMALGDVRTIERALAL
jgi:hypothetical protein